MAASCRGVDQENINLEQTAHGGAVCCAHGATAGESRMLQRGHRGLISRASRDESGDWREKAIQNTPHQNHRLIKETLLSRRQIRI
jgi:hypothetical protein